MKPLLEPRIATVVVAAFFPESSLEVAAELDRLETLRALPRVERRNHESQRVAVLRRQRGTRHPIRKETVRLFQRIERNARRVPVAAAGENPVRFGPRTDKLQQFDCRDSLPGNGSHAPRGDAVHVAHEAKPGQRAEIRPGEFARLVDFAGESQAEARNVDGRDGSDLVHDKSIDPALPRGKTCVGHARSIATSDVLANPAVAEEGIASEAQHMMPDVRPKVRVVCGTCGGALAPLAQACPRCPNALPRTEYAETRFCVEDRADIFRYSAWLPAASTVPTTVGPAVLRSERLATRLGLRDLVIAFSGYAPEIGARNVTGSFKDFEALPTLLYLREQGVGGVVLASAGNTARAFAHAATILAFPTTIVVPEVVATSIRIPIMPSSAVRLIAVSGSPDYSAAIRLAGLVSETYDLHSEGGARNIARRDGMGTALLEYARTERRLPRHYVQAVGSGTGAIATWEAAARLRASGEFSDPLPCLHVAQNVPFTPIHDAWTTGKEIEPERDIDGQLDRIRRISALVLANRTPPFAVDGGVRTALRATSGHTYAVTNGEIAAAQRLFHDVAGIAIGPESGAALAALSQGLARGWIPKKDPVLLHVTGNGEALLERDAILHRVPVWLTVPSERESALPALDRALAR